MPRRRKNRLNATTMYLMTYLNCKYAQTNMRSNMHTQTAYRKPCKLFNINPEKGAQYGMHEICILNNCSIKFVQIRIENYIVESV